MAEHRNLYGLPAVALSACILGTAGEVSGGRSPGGFYVGVGHGLGNAGTVESSLFYVSHPTKCDVLLYSDPGMAPIGVAECSDDNPRTRVNGFDPGTGFSSGLSAGYDLGRLRFEVEHLSRYQSDDASPLRSAGGGNEVLASKSGEWNPEDPPSERISDFRAHQLFVNAYHDFENDSPWTPYAGIGVGWARASLRYGFRFVRKTLEQGYQDVDAPLTPADRPAAAAGTLSLPDAGITENVFGFQSLAGVDYALGGKTSIGVKVRWARFGEMSDSVTYRLIRSHAPVRADGKTPFTGQLKFDGIEYRGVTLGLRYLF